MSEQEVVEAASVGRQLPGVFLRQAREAQGLTLGEVAGALKFSTRQIEALEGDNFELLQGKTFLRGFVRAYARLLRLAPEPLLEMLEEEVLPSAEQIVPPSNMGETDPVPFYRRHGKKILALVTLALVVTAGIWMYGDDLKFGTAVTVQPAAVALPAAPNAAQAQTAEQASSVTESTSAVAAPTATASVVTPVLTFDFSGLSWLEVKDAGGQVLLTGEFPAGQKQVATGKPPYQLWIGKASAVKVTYKDQVVDLQPYTRDEVARLTLDQ